MRPALALWIASLLPSAGLAETPQDFSGEWIVAHTGSPAIDAKEPATPGSHHGGGMGHGIGGGMGGGMGGGRGGGAMGSGGRRHAGSPADASARESPPAAPADPRLNAQALTIRQSDVVFDVAADGGKRTVYRFDNRNNYGPAYGGTVALTWAAPEMVIETHPDSGGSIEEHYTLSADGKKLTLRIHQQRAGADSAGDVTRVFVRAGTQGATSSTLP